MQYGGLVSIVCDSKARSFEVEWNEHLRRHKRSKSAGQTQLYWMLNWNINWIYFSLVGCEKNISQNCFLVVVAVVIAVVSQEQCEYILHLPSSVQTEESGTEKDLLVRSVFLKIFDVQWEKDFSANVNCAKWLDLWPGWLWFSKERKPFIFWCWCHLCLCKCNEYYLLVHLMLPKWTRYFYRGFL